MSTDRLPLPPPARLDSLTGLRAIAALMVFALHIAERNAVTSDTTDWLFQSGKSGVSFFFVLSGFVLAWSSRPGDSPRSFWQRRAARVLPLYWIGWIGGLALVTTRDGASALPSTLPSLVLLQAWTPDQSIYYAGNSVGWSLSCEAFFYLLFPLLIVLIRRFSVAQLRWVGSAIVVLTIAVPIVLHPSTHYGTEYWGAYIFPVTRSLEFVAGVVLALLVKANAWPRLPFLPTLLLASAALVATNLLPFYFSFAAATLIPFLLVIGSAAMRDAAGDHTVFTRLVFVKAGEWSYAFYLCHLLIIRGVILLDGRLLHLGTPFTALVALILSVTVSAVLCELVEKPLERRLRPSHRLPAVMER